MVLQILADAGQMPDRGDAVRPQAVGVADAGPLEDQRRADRAGRQHDLAGRLRLEGLAVAAILQRDGAPVLDRDPVDHHAGHNLQVRPVQDRLQEAACRAPAPPALLVDLEIGRALVVAGVEVVDLGHARRMRRVPDPVEDVPADTRMLHPPFAARAVKLARTIGMVLDRLEQRQDVVPAPALEAELAPMVVVRRLTAHVDHGVDRGRSAEGLAARIGEGPPVQPGLGRRLEHPVRARIADGEEIADRDVEPDPVVLAAPLQKQHAIARIGGEPVGEDASGRTGPGDDIVEFFHDLALAETFGLGNVGRCGRLRAAVTEVAGPPSGESFAIPAGSACFLSTHRGFSHSLR